jgi:cytochrome c biogenesis protein CcmG, thiol:disulfide interchange protein DsbE
LVLALMNDGVTDLMKAFRYALIGVVLAVLVGVLWTQRGRIGPLGVGSEAPSYAAHTVAGDTVRLADLRGRVVVLNVWATWCGPCVREMPALQRLHEQLSDRGLSVIAVSVDSEGLGLGGGDADVQSFVDEFGLTFTVLRDASGRIEDTFGVAGLPTTFVIDRDGRIERKVLGAREWDDPALAAEIESLLEG